MKIPRTYYSILAVFCTAVVCIGVVCAADHAQVLRNGTSFNGPGHQGFDLTNTTLQQEMLTKFQEQGIDVTGLQAAFQSGDMTEVREWMKEHHPTVAGNSPADKGRQGFDLTNTTLQQEMLTKFQEQGIDVTGLETAFQSGDMTEVREWMKEHRPTLSGIPPADKGRQGFDLTNTTLQQEMLTKFQEQGVDVTGLRAAFQSGNMTAVREWMQEYHPTGGIKGHHPVNRMSSASGQ